MTLNDLERRNSPYFAFFHQILQILGRFHSGWKEQTYNVRKILSSSSGNLDFVDISSRPELRCSSKNDDLRLVCVESLRRNRHRTAFEQLASLLRAGPASVTFMATSSCVSSANWWYETPWDSMSSPTGVTYAVKSSGPSTDLGEHQMCTYPREGNYKA